MEKAHEYPHGAFKDLVANARDAKATCCNIMSDTINGCTVLKIWDDGKGPCDKETGRLTEQSFVKVLDLGHSIALDENVTIGGNGVGLKTGLLSIARDTVVVSHNSSEIFVALLSASLHERLEVMKKPKTELPFMKFNKLTHKWTTTKDATKHCETHTKLRLLLACCLRLLDPCALPATISSRLPMYHLLPCACSQNVHRLQRGRGQT